jgi:hypothetical protein
MGDMKIADIAAADNAGEPVYKWQVQFSAVLHAVFCSEHLM